MRNESDLGPWPRNAAVEYAETPLVAFCAAGRLAGTCDARAEAFRAVGLLGASVVRGEEELLLTDMAGRGRWACYGEGAVLRHRPSEVRGPRNVAGSACARRR
ncbi:hypothetical protein FHR84_001124 [Actinopolyspora biskrensis]|uniref:Uncharacterized protein n=1 Tax=Actinopolyspora biskrensis TaxID=1470178 RepID=A0A852YUS2_9ACTN|nr:hypothetical protein [Actinopolyspora biskrensis]NYH77810.1 hypothetical protein [Actinopolyspora biskrensis]